MAMSLFIQACIVEFYTFLNLLLYATYSHCNLFIPQHNVLVSSHYTYRCENIVVSKQPYLGFPSLCQVEYLTNSFMSLVSCFSEKKIKVMINFFLTLSPNLQQ